MRREDTTLYADLTLKYMYKGDVPGHEFHGNQYGTGQGGTASEGGSSGSSGSDKRNTQNEIIRHYESMRGDRVGETGKKMKLSNGLYEVGATDIKVEGGMAHRTDRVTLRKQGESFSIKTPADRVAHLGNHPVYQINRDENTVKRISELQDSL